jgi:hypothetical protein
MHQFTMTVMALALFGAMAATAQADVLRGSPQRNGNQCFTYSAGNATDSRFGFWGACPQPAGASTAVAAAPRVRVRRTRARSLRRVSAGPRPVFRRPMFMSCTDLVALVLKRFLHRTDHEEI